VITIFALALAQTVPNLQMKHHIVMPVDALMFMQRNEKPQWGPAGSLIIDETGTYVFSQENRFNLKTRHSVGFGSVISYFGPRMLPTSLGGLRSRWTVGMYPDLDKYFLQEVVDVFYSSDGGDLWLKTQIWKHNGDGGAEGVGRMYLSKPEDGFSAGLSGAISFLNFDMAMGVDGKSYALFRYPYESYEPSKTPGHWPPPIGKGDILMGEYPKGTTRQVKVPRGMVTNLNASFGSWQLDPIRKLIVGFRGVGKSDIYLLDVKGPTARVRLVHLPLDQKYNVSEQHYYRIPTAVWISPKAGNILLQMRDRGEKAVKEPGYRHTLWLYNVKTSKWREVGNYRVLAWSGSSKLMLVGGDAYSDPAWLIRLEE